MGDILYAVFNKASSPSMTDMTVTATGGDIHYAVYNTGSSPSMTMVTAVATGGDINRAVFNTEFLAGDSSEHAGRELDVR